MNISKEFVTKYNLPSTLFVLTSFPKKGGEVAEENAVARYSHLLLQNFPQTKKIVVLTEDFVSTEPFEVSENILVIPTYKLGSPLLVMQLIRVLSQFNFARDLMIQFEFSIFGGKIALPGIVLFLLWGRARNLYVSFMFHQVVRDLGKISGHLGIAKRSIERVFLNLLLSTFYRVVGALSTNVIVHDTLLKDRLIGLVAEKKLFVIPHGCGETEYLSPKLRVKYRRKFGIKSNELAILAYGYLSWYKGTDWLIKTVGDLAKRHPERKIKLLLTGVQNPTLRGTKAYAQYRRKLAVLLKRYEHVVIAPGFIPESEVSGVFAAADIAVFPYRVKISASGALSVAWEYGKRILVSREFAKNYEESDAKEILQNFDVSADQLTFQLNPLSFQETLFDLLDRPGAGYKVARASKTIAQVRSWKNMAQAYNEVCTSDAVGAVSENQSYTYVS